jgi:hypothetical protein
MNNNDIVTLVNVKTGAHCRKRITIFNLWEKDKDGDTRNGGWAIADKEIADKGEFTAAIGGKMASQPTIVAAPAAPVVKKKDADFAVSDKMEEPIAVKETIEDDPNAIEPTQELEPAKPVPVKKAPAKRKPAPKRKR